jgi:hypothetical protein
MLLHVADIDLVGHLAGNPVDDDRHSAKTSVLALVWSSASSAIAAPYCEIHRFDAFLVSFFERSPWSISLMFGK